MSWENIEDAFKELDKQEFAFIARALSSFRQALIKEGFTRREAVRFVETYSRFIYDMSMEEFIAEKNSELDFPEEEDTDEDVDPSEGIG